MPDLPDFFIPDEEQKPNKDLPNFFIPDEETTPAETEVAELDTPEVPEPPPETDGIVVEGNKIEPADQLIPKPVFFTQPTDDEPQLGQKLEQAVDTAKGRVQSSILGLLGVRPKAREGFLDPKGRKELPLTPREATLAKTMETGARGITTFLKLAEGLLEVESRLKSAPAAIATSIATGGNPLSDGTIKDIIKGDATRIPDGSEQISNIVSLARRWHKVNLDALQKDLPDSDIVRDPSLILDASWWSGSMSSTIGSMGQALMFGPAGAPVAGGLLEAVPEFERLETEGVPLHESLRRAAVFGAIVYGLEKVGFDNILKTKQGGSIMRRFLFSGSVESITEALEEPFATISGDLGRIPWPEFSKRLAGTLRQMVNVAIPTFVTGGGVGASSQFTFNRASQSLQKKVDSGQMVYADLADDFKVKIPDNYIKTGDFYTPKDVSELIDQATEATDKANKAEQPIVPPEQVAIPTLIETLDTATTREEASIALQGSIATKEGTLEMLSVYKRMLNDGLIEAREGTITKDEIAQEVADGWRKIKGIVPPRTLASESRVVEDNRPAIQRIESYITHVADVASKSTLAKGRPGFESVERVEASEFVGNLNNALKSLSEIPFVPENVDAVLNGMARTKELKPVESLTRNQTIARLFTIFAKGVKSKTQKKKLVDDAVRNVLGIDADQRVSLRDLTDEEVQRVALSVPQQKVKGVGRGTVAAMKAMLDAETKEDALKSINDIRSLEGKPAIVPIDASQLLAEGKQVYTLSPDERELMVSNMPSQFAKTEAGRYAYNLILDGIARPLPNPVTNPQEFLNEKKLINSMAAMAYRGTEEGRAGVLGWWSGTLDKALLFGSNRYVFADISGRTGDLEVFTLYNLVQREVKRGTFESQQRIALVFPDIEVDQEKSDITDKRATELANRESTPDVRWKTKIGTHPTASLDISTILFYNDQADLSSELRLQMAQAKSRLGIELLETEQEILSKTGKPAPSVDQNAKGFRDIIEGINRELQGPSLENLRFIQVNEFMSEWKKVGPDILWLEARLHNVLEKNMNERQRSQLKQLNDLKEQVSNVSPWFFNEKTQDGEMVDRQELLDAAEIFTTQGREALRAHVKTRNWGGRKTYWMTNRDIVRTLAPTVSEVTKKQSMSKIEKQLGVTSEVNHRTGLAAPKTDDIIGAVYRHMRNLEVQARTYEYAIPLKQKIERYSNAGLIPESVSEGMSLFLDVQWGKSPVRASKGSRFFLRANKVWWTLYPLAFTRMAWYNARNLLFQGAPWGPINTQFNVIDAQWGYWKFITGMENPRSGVRKYLSENFKRDLSQQQELFYQQFAQMNPGEHELAVTFWSRQKAYEIASRILGFSDNINRTLIGGASYVITEKYIEDYINGVAQSQGNTAGQQNKVVRGLLLNKLHPVQQNMLMQIFDEALLEGGNRESFEPFIREVSMIKNENVNYLYSLSGRSPFEQDPNNRWMLGVATYQRGTFDRLLRNGISPLVREYNNWAMTGDFDSQAVASASSVIAMNVFVHAISSVVFSYLIGDRESRNRFRKKGSKAATYSLPNSLTYNPGAPGFWAVVDFLDNGNQLVWALGASDWNQSNKQLKILLERASYFLGILPDLANWGEAIGNRRMAENCRKLSEWGISNGIFADRNAYESFMHFFFATFEMPDKRGLNKRFLDSLGKD